MTDDTQRLIDMLQQGVKALVEIQNKYPDDDLLVSRCSRTSITINTIKRTLRKKN